MKSLVVKRSIVIGGHKTSVSLEHAFWQAFKAIALITLEAWAKEKDQKILAISEDQGWADFAGNSDWKDVEKE